MIIALLQAMEYSYLAIRALKHFILLSELYSASGFVSPQSDDKESTVQLTS